MLLVQMVEAPSDQLLAQAEALLTLMKHLEVRLCRQAPELSRGPLAARQFLAMAFDPVAA